MSRRLAGLRLVTLQPFSPVPDRLIVAPTDLRSADPFVAEQILEGRFHLAGRLLEAGDRSPFSLEMPSRDFASRLHAFTWLRDVRASKSDLIFDAARLLTEDWIASHGRRPGGIAWDPDIVAQRIIAWISHSTILLKNAEIGFYRRFLRSLSAQIRFLESTVTHIRDDERRLRGRIALAMATLALPASARKISKAAGLLDRELEAQILPDGGHVSRNPRAGLELLFDLLPLRQTYVNLGQDLPSRLVQTIDRMYPALRFFRHQGGELALFNGATSTHANELLSILRYDETAGKPFKALPHTQYQRVAVGDTVILVDTGLPLTRELSRTAHAGCLSLEMSSGKHRFIVNSGSPRFAGDHYRQLARATAAHSTVTINDTSSSRVLSNSGSLTFAEGVEQVTVDRKEGQDGGDTLVASHDGYLKPFGLIHERSLYVNAAGSLVRGRDRLMTSDRKDPPAGSGSTAVIRFHIHPQIAIHEIEDNEVDLVAPDGETWTLSTLDGRITIEDDVFFADPSGIRGSSQLEMVIDIDDLPELQWVLTRKPSGPQ
ncbi:MAG: hypothetical protein RLZZ444_196 [Pseudomonadota bacterium]